MSLIKRLFIQVSSCLLVYQSGSFTFLREDIHLWIGEGSNLWCKRWNFYGIPSTLVINFLLSKQVIMLSEKGGLFGNCFCFNDSWNVAFGYRVEFC